MTASTLHDADPVDKRKVHKHMCHKESTADKYYMTAARTRVACESHDIIRRNLGLDKDDQDQAETQQNDHPLKEKRRAKGIKRVGTGRMRGRGRRAKRTRGV